MKYIKHEIDWKTCIDLDDLMDFMVNNSKKSRDAILMVIRAADLFEEYSGIIGYIGFIPEEEVYNPNKNTLFFQRMVNAFFEAYNIDKSEMITVVFTD